jgi:hypothetical protein
MGRDERAAITRQTSNILKLDLINAVLDLAKIEVSNNLLSATIVAGRRNFAGAARVRFQQSVSAAMHDARMIFMGEPFRRSQTNH